MERQQQPPVSTRMSMSSSTLSSMLESVSPLSAKNLTSAQGTSHVQGSGHSGATHSPPASSSGGSDSSYTSGGVAPVAGTSATTSATNQFADANTSQQALPVTTTIDASSSPSSSSSKPKEVFDFTKRKRYADLLTTELTEAIILVLSLNGDVWYCGNAVQDLLGWRDDEVVDRKFSEFINADDRAKFQTMFRESIQQKSELLSYARLQCKQTEPFVITATTSGVGEFTSSPAKEVLFEIKGYPHFLPDTDEFKCFFAVAKPYPSRNTAMLNTYLELKMENDRLHEKLSQLRIRKGSVSSASPSVPTSSSAGPTATTPTSQYHPHVPQYPQLYTQEPATHGIIPPPLPNGELPANSGFYGGAYEEPMLPGPSNIRFDTSNAYGQGQGSGSAVGEEDNGSGATGTGDPNGPRKKLKKVYTAEQYVCVTCGRTDSPEWRKGPTGPKTLCNACGLRWAKRVRTSKGEEAGTGKSAS